MLKLLLNLAMVSMITLNSAESAGILTEPQKRGEIIGRVYNNGVTFATKENATEALIRGEYDPINPFVRNVFQLTHTINAATGETYSSTVTQIAPGILLCCKHAAIKLLERIQSLTPQTNENEIGLLANKGIATIRADSIKAELHDKADLALLKFTPDKIIETTIPNANFLTIAKTITETTGQGFVVSHSYVSIAGQQEPVESFKRTISIHEFTKQSDMFVSFLPGIIPEDQQETLRNAMNISDEQTIKNIANAAHFIFPETTEKPSRRLMSLIRHGASGSPLVVKIEKNFKIMGLLIKSGTMTDKEDVALTIHQHHFLNLATPEIHSWIEDKIKKLNN